MSSMTPNEDVSLQFTSIVERPATETIVLWLCGCVMHKTSILFISRRCFAKAGKEMYQK